MARYYLDQQHIDWKLARDTDKRQPQFQGEIEKYGFPSWETWSLDETMLQLLYERVKMYQDINGVDTTYHTIIVGDEEKTQGQWMNTLLELLEDIFRENKENYFNKDAQVEKRVWEIWAALSPVMWW